MARMEDSVFIFLALCAFCHGGCPAGWVEAPFGMCYNLVQRPMVDWEGAMSICRDYGGELATLETQQKIAFMQGYIYMHHRATDNGYWIGALRENGAWTWQMPSTGSKMRVTSFNWARAMGEPNNSGGHENCLEVYQFGGVHGAWNDATCSLARKYICQVRRT